MKKHFIGKALASSPSLALGFTGSLKDQAANSKILGLLSLKRRQHRHTQGGFFMPVRCANAVNAGYAWTTRRCKPKQARRALLDDKSTRQLLPNLKNQKSTETMNASISMGASAHNPLQALARLLPTAKPS
ncbi:MAG: hypothetical protein BWK73_49650, partial [Thiothrix lacustris]